MRVIQDSARRQQGASLIEVLVSILVVSLGVVAMGGLLASATRLGKASEIRAVASLMAADISDRMKANAAAVRLSQYDHVAAFVVPPDEPSVEACDNPNECTADELAKRDLAEWRRALLHALPAGTGYLKYDAAAQDAGGAVDVWIAWLDPKALSVDAFQTVEDQNANCPADFRNLDPQPRCMYFRVAL